MAASLTETLSIVPTQAPNCPNLNPYPATDVPHVIVIDFLPVDELTVFPLAPLRFTSGDPPDVFT